MRRSLPEQPVLVPAFHPHARSRELRAMSQILDQHPEAAEWVLRDLVGRQTSSRLGREGMSGEQVLRAMLVKQLGQFTYEEVAFHLVDSMSYRAFCRIGLGQTTPTAKTLQRNIKMVEAQTLEKINRLLVEDAAMAGIEDGSKIRVDCTVTETNIHEPSDSSLLWDSVRVLVRLMYRAQDYVNAPFTDQQRRAKRRMIGIQYARSREERLPLYQDLIKVTDKTVSAAQRVVATFASTYPPEALENPVIYDLLEQLRHYLELAGRVLDQSRRRVLLGETVPATEKLVSIFETHTDIIVKDRRETLYGHKLCLATGASGLVTDCRIEKGNPADATLATAMIERQRALYGRSPAQVSFDGGFASRANLDDIKKLGVRDVVFSKSKGITADEMAGGETEVRKLRHFRAGIEATISWLKRCFGWGRCLWRSLRSFRAYVWASVVAANLQRLARTEIG